MTITLPSAPAPDKLEALRALRGTFKNGHTDDDVASALGEVFNLTGIRFAVVWDFDDIYGLGGNSELHFVDEAGRLRDTPGGWCEFLYDPDSEIDVTTLFSVRAGNAVQNWKRIHQFSCDEHNYFRRAYEGEAP